MGLESTTFIVGPNLMHIYEEIFCLSVRINEAVLFCPEK